MNVFKLLYESKDIEDSVLVARQEDMFVIYRKDILC